MTTTYKVRCFPSNEIVQTIFENFEVLRNFHNWNVSTILTARKNNQFLSWLDTQAMLPKLKEQDPAYKKVYAKVLQLQNRELHANIKARDVKRKRGDKKVKMPRFKNEEGSFKRIGYNQFGYSVDNNICKLSKIGEIPFKKSRDIKGNIRQIILKKKRTKYYLYFVTDYVRTWKTTGKSVGIDWGVTKFLTLSNDIAFASYYPQLMYDNLKKKIYKAISRTQKNSNNRNKLKLRLSKINETIHNKRMDWTYKIKLYLLDTFDNISFEDVRIQDLCKIKSWKISKEKMMLSCLGMLRSMLSCEVESTNKIAKEVSKTNTSQECSKCGHIPKTKKTLADREHNCIKCGLVCDRDQNSSRVVLSRGMGQSSSFAEIEPLHVISPLDVISGKFYCRSN